MIRLNWRAIQIKTPIRINSDKKIILSNPVETSLDWMITILIAAGPINKGKVSGISDISSFLSMSSSEKR